MNDAADALDVIRTNQPTSLPAHVVVDHVTKHVRRYVTKPLGAATAEQVRQLFKDKNDTCYQTSEEAWQW